MLKLVKLRTAPCSTSSMITCLGRSTVSYHKRKRVVFGMVTATNMSNTPDKSQS